MRFLILLLLLAGCTATTTPTATPEPTTLWGKLHQVAQAPQPDAPAMWSDGGRVVMAWIQAQNFVPQIALRAFENGQLSPVTILPLSLRNPYRLTIMPGKSGSTHVFWMDVNSDGETRVYSAYLAASLQIERGQIEVSNLRVEDYDVYSGHADGSLWLVWSGGLQAERSLYANLIDPIGRPRISQFLIADADRPTFAPNGDLLWIRASDVYRAGFDGETLLDVTPVIQRVTQAPGDLLLRFEAAGAYLFWTVLRADGIPQTWFSFNGSSPVQLALSEPLSEAFQTGFNSGAVSAARTGDQSVLWASPLATQSDVLPVAGQIGNKISVIYLQQGTVAGVQSITSLNADLIGFPSITTDSDHHLFLAWSLPSAEYADLLLTTTRR